MRVSASEDFNESATSLAGANHGHFFASEVKSAYQVNPETSARNSSVFFARALLAPRENCTMIPYTPGLRMAWVLVLSLLWAGVASASTIVRFDTTVGDVDVRLFDTATPNSVANFLNYVTSGRYVDTFIHRVPQRFGVSSNFVVQGGGFKLNNSIFAATGINTDPPIGDEPGLTNLPETLAFAKNSLGATSQWFFSIGDNTFLDDQDFTVFGRVIRNTMGTVSTINDLDNINASAAENAPGEDFDEVPVTDIDAVLSQNDITNNEAVLINSITVLDFDPADYNFNGVVDNDDLAVWQAQFGSSLHISDHISGSPTTFADADGNGDGRIDGLDLLCGQVRFDQGQGSQRRGVGLALGRQGDLGRPTGTGGQAQ